VNGPLVLRFFDRVALEQEHARNFAHGRAFVSGVYGYALFTPCRLVIEHPDNGAQCDVDVEVVMVLEEGIALQFRDRSSSELERVSAFIGTSPGADNHNAYALEVGESDDLVTLDDVYEMDPPSEDEGAETEQDNESKSESESDRESENEREGESKRDGESEDEAQARLAGRLNLVTERQQRLRNIDMGERMRIARGTNMELRVLLERLYGAAVWDALLHNPKITIPEVARIAKKGTLSRPLIDMIVDNEQWIHQSLVRRALLGNPRLGPESAMKVLRTLPQRELKLVPHQTAYPATVRSAAARLIKG
jgi:hypothetical protein